LYNARKENNAKTLVTIALKPKKKLLRDGSQLTPLIRDEEFFAD
jgi:hypothetical protein